MLPYTSVNTLEAAPGHKVLKTNCIRYKGNTYSLPSGTYKDETSRVYLKEEYGDLIVNNDNGINFYFSFSSCIASDAITWAWGRSGYLW